MSKLKYALILLGFIGLLSGCKDKQYLVGYYEDYASYQEVCKWEKFVDEKYTPRERWVDSLRSLEVDRPLHMRLFLGAYCGDSKKWVPRFYALKEELPEMDVLIVSVDTTKKDVRGLYKDVGLEKIPTFVLYDGETEVGRIVEKPKGRLEKNLFHLLKNL